MKIDCKSLGMEDVCFQCDPEKSRMCVIEMNFNYLKAIRNHKNVLMIWAKHGISISHIKKAIELYDSNLLSIFDKYLLLI